MSRRYLQFNELVFDGKIEDKEFPTYSFKSSSVENTFWHGEYVEFNGLVKATSLNLNILYDTSELNCYYRKYFRSYIISQLIKKGKLWAIDEDNRLIYANAIVESYSLNDEYSNRFELDISLSLYEGVWNVASGTNTFLADWSICSFLECVGYREVNECDNCYTGSNNLCEESCCSCFDITCNDSLCNTNLNDVDGNKIIFYDETLGHRLNGKRSLGYGLELMKPGEYLKSENLYIPTDFPCYCDIFINGFYKTPYITINGNENYFDIDASSDSRLIGIKCNGDIVEIIDCEETILPITTWNIPSGQSFGYKLKPLYNNISINRGLKEKAFEVFIRPHTLTL